MAMERTNGLRAGVAALIAGFVVSQGAFAEPSINAETVHRAIDVRALNLSSPAGAQEAYKRITAARTARTNGPGVTPSSSAARRALDALRGAGTLVLSMP